MDYVGKLGSLFTSVHNFYNEINPATLSGAIDIVVVEQQDGDLACSPFHVRFGKLSVLMPQEKRVRIERKNENKCCQVLLTCVYLKKKVQIKVNGETVPYVMKVGEAGEAFFVFETEHEVPEEFQTSPIMEAVSEKSDEVTIKKKYVYMYDDYKYSLFFIFFRILHILTLVNQKMPPKVKLPIPSKMKTNNKNTSYPYLPNFNPLK